MPGGLLSLIVGFQPPEPRAAWWVVTITAAGSGAALIHVKGAEGTLELIMGRDWKSFEVHVKKP